jgi:hypothetical protein
MPNNASVAVSISALNHPAIVNGYAVTTADATTSSWFVPEKSRATAQVSLTARKWVARIAE